MRPAKGTDNQNQLLADLSRLSTEKPQLYGLECGKSTAQGSHEGPDFKLFSKFQQRVKRRLITKDKAPHGPQGAASQNHTQCNKKSRGKCG